MKSSDIVQKTLMMIATLELWLSFIVYDYALSTEVNVWANLGLGALFVYFNNKTGQGVFGPHIHFKWQSVVIVTGLISCGGYFWNWNPLELFFRMIIAYGATIALQTMRIFLLKMMQMDASGQFSVKETR